MAGVRVPMYAAVFVFYHLISSLSCTVASHNDDVIEVRQSDHIYFINDNNIDELYEFLFDCPPTVSVIASVCSNNSCEGLCGFQAGETPHGPEFCSCDSNCIIYKDCCFDFEEKCPTEEEKSHEVSKLVGVQTECVSPGYNVISGCCCGAEMNPESANRIFEVNVTTDCTTNLHYIDLDILKCNADTHESDTSFWSTQVSFDSVPDLVKIKKLSDFKNAIEPSQINMPDLRIRSRKCGFQHSILPGCFKVPWSESCPEIISTSLTYLCSKVMKNIDIFNNTPLPTGSELSNMILENTPCFWTSKLYHQVKDEFSVLMLITTNEFSATLTSSNILDPWAQMKCANNGLKQRSGFSCEITKCFPNQLLYEGECWIPTELEIHFCFLNQRKAKSSFSTNFQTEMLKLLPNTWEKTRVSTVGPNVSISYKKEDPEMDKDVSFSKNIVSREYFENVLVETNSTGLLLSFQACLHLTHSYFYSEKVKCLSVDPHNPHSTRQQAAAGKNDATSLEVFSLIFSLAGFVWASAASGWPTLLVG